VLLRLISRVTLLKMVRVRVDVVGGGVAVVAAVVAGVACAGAPRARVVAADTEVAGVLRIPRISVVGCCWCGCCGGCAWRGKGWCWCSGGW